MAINYVCNLISLSKNIENKQYFSDDELNTVINLIVVT